ncbi:MAG: hypothetical protein JXB32_14125 [Deltaproteobacteria bacterium]|nr:hypothetical protein [Deltaproteobacteria bacterium]
MAAMDTGPEASEMQLAIYRRMSPERRLRVGLELTELSRKLLREGIRRRHPEYGEPEVLQAFRRLWLGAELFHSAYPADRELEP